MSTNSSGLFMRLCNAIARHARERATIAELARLSDRELRDIGIGRVDISRIARELAGS